jgi:hypothetical protein
MHSNNENIKDDYKNIYDEYNNKISNYEKSNIENETKIKIVIVYNSLKEENNKITKMETKKENIKKECPRKEKKVTFSNTNNVYNYEKDKKYMWDISSDEETDEEDWSRY